VVSRSTVMPSAPDPDGTPVEVGAEALAGHRLVAWSALIDVPDVDAPPDGVAIATVSWPIPASSALGSTSLVLVLADRRGDLSTVTGWSTKP
jgi:hypothetical protein